MPGKKKKSKKAQDGGTTELESELPPLSELLLAALLPTGLKTLATILCLPDHNTTRGLKQWHQTFETISSKLKQVFVLSRGSPQIDPMADKLAATVIQIYGQVCVDKVLRGRIFKETDFLENATSLLHSDMARPIVMPVLSSITHLEGADLKALAPFTPAILDSVEGHLDDLKLAETALCVVAHSTTLVLKDDHPDPALASLVSLPRIIQFFLSVVRLPTSTSPSFNHLLDFCAQTAEYHPMVFRSIPDSVDFLIACTRANDLCARNAALRSLTGLFIPANQRESLAAYQSITERPARAHQALIQYGLHKTSDRRRLLEFERLTALIGTFAANSRGSLPRFGNTLVDSILRNELELRVYFMNPGTVLDDGTIRRLQVDLGFTRFADLLRLSSEAVRRSGAAQAEINGDILHVEFLLACERDVEACTLARTCIERHPDVGYFYYVLVADLSDADHIASARFAEKGLQCPNLTDFLREELLYYNALCSDRVVAGILEGRPSEIPFGEVVALTRKAMLNVVVFIGSAPPDSDRMPHMIALSIHLALLVRGHTFSDDCRELQVIREKLFLVYDIARSSDHGFYPLPQCLAVDKIFARMPIAWGMWKSTVRQHPSESYSNSDPNVDLAAWLEKLDTSDPVSQFFETRGVNRDAGRSGAAQIHHCSSCNSPSVALKQCSGCKTTRYCNSDCQSRHWKVHRKVCTGKQ